VNSEGELPLDVSTEDAMERLLKGEIKKQGEESLRTDVYASPPTSGMLYLVCPVETRLCL